MAQPKSPSTGQLGCGFLLSTGIVLLVLLWLNTVFVKTFFAANLAKIDERVFNAAQFMLPIILIFIEFWIYDAIKDYWIVRRKSESGR